MAPAAEQREASLRRRSEQRGHAPDPALEERDQQPESFDPGPGRYDSRRAKRAARRREKTERKRREEGRAQTPKTGQARAGRPPVKAPVPSGKQAESKPGRRDVEAIRREGPPRAPPSRDRGAGQAGAVGRAASAAELAGKGDRRGTPRRESPGLRRGAAPSRRSCSRGAPAPRAPVASRARADRSATAAEPEAADGQGRDLLAGRGDGGRRGGGLSARAAAAADRRRGHGRLGGAGGSPAWRPLGPRHAQGPDKGAVTTRSWLPIPTTPRPRPGSGPSRGGRRHEGQDVFARPGTPLVAVRDGVVLDGGGGKSFYSYGGGNTFVNVQPAGRPQLHLPPHEETRP